MIDAEDHVGSGAALHAIAVDVAPQPRWITVGELFWRDEPWSEGIERCAVLALVPLPAALKLKLALGEIARQYETADDRSSLALVLQVARLTANYDTELNFPIGLGAAARQYNVIGRPYNCNGGFKTTGSDGAACPDSRA